MNLEHLELQEHQEPMEPLEHLARYQDQLDPLVHPVSMVLLVALDLREKLDLLVPLD